MKERDDVDEVCKVLRGWVAEALLARRFLKGCEVATAGEEKRELGPEEEDDDDELVELPLDWNSPNNSRFSFL